MWLRATALLALELEPEGDVGGRWSLFVSSVRAPFEVEACS